MEDRAGPVGDGEFVVAGGDSAPLFDQGKGPLDDVAVFVGVGIERGRATALGPFPFACGNLIALLRDHGPDLAGAKHAPVHPAGVGLVCQDRVRTGTRPSAANPGNPDVSQDLLEHCPVITLTAGDHDRQRQPMAIDGVVDLRGQPAAGATDAVTGRFNLVK